MFVESTWENLTAITPPVAVASGTAPALSTQGGLVCTASGFLSGVGADGVAFTNVPLAAGNVALPLRFKAITTFTGTGLFVVVRT